MLNSYSHPFLSRLLMLLACAFIFLNLPSINAQDKARSFIIAGVSVDGNTYSDAQTIITISGLKVILSEDFSSRREIEEKVKLKLSKLELLDDDEEAIEASRLLKSFLSECEKHSKKLNKLELKESIYEDALRGTQAQHQREFILRKLEEIDKEKQTFIEVNVSTGS